MWRIRQDYPINFIRIKSIEDLSLIKRFVNFPNNCYQLKRPPEPFCELLSQLCGPGSLPGVQGI